ncbi:alpha/beta hydrolase [Lactococcus lactis]|uniref:alpha/beta hydrolase n=1 Tax=Lactococcus lactis TaxID=1358 RepID=UPI002905E5F4|nr:alpha/beta hydrolase [Lactococcus lactis]
MQNYERVDKSIQAVLLAGDYDSEKQTDGTVPWAVVFQSIVTDEKWKFCSSLSY